MMEKFILTLLKTTVYLYDSDSTKHLIRGTVLLPPTDRKILITINKKHDVAAIFPEDLSEPTTTEALSPLLLVHFDAKSQKFCGIVITGLNAFIMDWKVKGGIDSILPALRRFAGRY
jgi:hypothetical protein